MNLVSRPSSSYSKALAIFLSILGLLNFFSTIFISKTYSFDFSHRLYFGMRFFHGGLPYVTEFDDKLPFTHYLFGLSYALGGRYIYALLTLSLIIISSIYLTHFHYELISYTRSLTTSSLHRRSRFSYLALFYFGLISLTPFSFTQINSVAASCFLVGWCMSYSQISSNPHQNLALKSTLSGLFIAAAVSLRPYYIFPLLASFLIFLVCHNLITESDSSPYAVLRHLLVLLLSSCFWVIVLNFFPFVFSPHSVGPLLQGVLAQTSSLIQQDYLHKTQDILKSLLRSPLIPLSIGYSFVKLMIYVKSITRKVNYIQPAHLYIIIGWSLVSIVMPLALLSAFLAKHYWPYYITLFTPLVALSLVFVDVAGMGCFLPSTRFKNSNMHLTFFLILSLMAAVGFVKATHTHLVLRREVQKEALRGKTLDSYLTLNQKSSGFLFLNSMNQHTRYKASRHAFPHTANLTHIRDGHWSRSALPVQYFPKIYDDQSLCDALITTEVTLFSDRYFIAPNCLSRLLLSKNVISRTGFYPSNRSSDILIITPRKPKN